MHRDIQSVKHLHVWCGNWHPLVCTRTDFCKMLADNWLVARALSRSTRVQLWGKGSRNFRRARERLSWTFRLGSILVVLNRALRQVKPIER
jgi:hypothetical protein